jgi:hypothetical protein
MHTKGNNIDFRQKTQIKHTCACKFQPVYLSQRLRQIAANARKSKYQWHTMYMSHILLWKLHLITQWKLAEDTSTLKSSDTRTENIVHMDSKSATLSRVHL